jgi:hypothetical protein
MKNWMKEEYKYFLESYYNYINYNTWDYFYDNLNKTKYFLFNSDKENVLLIKNRYYEVINNEWVSSFIPKGNINNYIWRRNYKFNIANYSSQFQKEQGLRKLRADILEKLK